MWQYDYRLVQASKKQQQYWDGVPTNVNGAIEGQHNNRHLQLFHNSVVWIISKVWCKEGQQFQRMDLVQMET